MPLGLISNCLAVFLGGMAGKILGGRMSDRIKENLTVILGICALMIGIVNVIQVSAMPPVVLSILVGTAVGEILSLEGKIAGVFRLALKKIPLKDNVDMERYVMVVVLFCASGFGIFGVLMEGVSGNSSILLSKSVLDFFTAFIFGSTLGIAVSLIAIPQFIIFIMLFLLSKSISPLISEAMFSDFIACGGVLTIASGLRISSIKKIPIGNMILSLILILPFTYLWSIVK